MPTELTIDKIMPNELEIDCSDPMYWGNVCTTGTYTSGTSTTTGTYTYPTYPNIAGTSTITMSPSNLTWTVGQGVEKEYVEKLEKHIDELEEDIEYFNNKLEEKDAVIYTLQHQTTELDKANKTMEAHITYLEGRLQALEDKINK